MAKNIQAAVQHLPHPELSPKDRAGFSRGIDASHIKPSGRSLGSGSSGILSGCRRRGRIR